MADNRKNLQDFQGEISESVKVTRWGVPVAGSGQTSPNSNNFFMHYASNNQSPTEEVYQTNYTQTKKILEETRKQTTSVNQINHMESGFRKFKNNQAMTLKQLKQQYEILRSLPVQQRIPLSVKEPDSSNSSSRQERSEISSKHNSKAARRQSGSKEFQLLVLQKKQLEIVIGNSMKKIQELLHNEMTYKKQIHQLKLQLDDKSPEEKYQNLIRNLKKNESDANQTIESLKREIQRLKGVNKQHTDTITRFESQVLSKNQQLIKNAQERRKFDDLVRFQKEKYSNLQIQVRRVKMEFEVLQKDKNNQIMRLNKQIQHKDAMYEREWGVKVKRLEEQLHMRENRYTLLLDQFEQMKKNGSSDLVNKSQMREKPDEMAEMKKILREAISSSAGNTQNFQIKQLLAKLEDLKDQNRQLRAELRGITEQAMEDPKKSQIFMDTINEIFNKMDRTNKTTDQILKKQIAMLKTQIQQVHKRPDNAQKIKQQDQIIQQLQKIINQQNYQKKKFVKEIQNMREEYETVRAINEKNKIHLSELLEKQKAYKMEITQLRHQKDLIAKELQIIESVKNSFSSSQSEVLQLRQKVIRYDDLQTTNRDLKVELAQIKTQLKQKEEQFAKEQRTLKRKLDELDFQTQKLRKQGSFNLDMEKSTHMVELNRVKSQIDQHRTQKNHYLSELEKMKAFYEAKLLEKNNQIQQRETLKVKEIQNVRKQYEQNIQSKTVEFQSIKIQRDQMNKSKIFELQGAKKTVEQQMRDNLRSKQQQLIAQKRYFESLIKGIHQKHEQLLRRISQDNEGGVLSIREKHERELSVILKKMEMLTDANEQFMIQNQKYLEMDKQIQQLRRIVKNQKSMTDGVDHLWQIKETEYNNIHEILRVMKGVPS